MPVTPFLFGVTRARCLRICSMAVAPWGKGEAGAALWRGGGRSPECI